MSHMDDTQPVWSDDRKVLVRSQLNIPGLTMIGHANLRTSLETLEPHSHCSMEFVAVIKGRQQYVTGEKKYTLQGGDVFMTYPEEVHGNGSFPQEICEFVWFQIDLSVKENFLGLTSSLGQELYQQLCNYRFRIVRAGQSDLLKLRKAFYLLSEQNVQSRLLGYSHFLEFVVQNLIFGTEGGKVQPGAESYISEALNYIHTRLTENPTLENIAEYCGTSPSQFNTDFKDHMGITPHAYITNLKIDTARILLKNPENTVTDVAYQLNFSSGNHFSTVFKRYTGCTPTQYRQQKYADI